jgi:hypothetical protein
MIALPRLAMVAFLTVTVTPGFVRATPSGLNNIPTADTTGARALVLQGFSTFGQNRAPAHFAGFKMGLHPLSHRVEWGLDSRIAPDSAGPAILQFKYALPLQTSGPILGLGVANLALTGGDRDDAGQPFSYVVFTHDFGWTRAHAGYGLQSRNNAAFAGLDRTFKILDRDFMLRADLIQIENRDRLLGSIGFLYVLHKSWVLESWISQTTEHGDASFTVKLNFIIPVLWRFAAVTQ